MAKSPKERMREYRARARARGQSPAADNQAKLNARRAAKREAGESYYDRVKKKAQNSVGAAIRKGKMVRQPCEICGDPNAEAHHDDYSQKRNVRWLCRAHHEEHHHTE